MSNRDFAAQRIKMVDGQVRTVDVTNVPLLDTLLDIPREDFVPEPRREFAYKDGDLLVSSPGGKPRYLMAASDFARLAQLADVFSDNAVLVVGAATGYSAAVLSRLAHSVVALEEDAALADFAAAALAAHGCTNARVERGPLVAGCSARAPYDVILIEGAVDDVPDALLKQLKEGGRLVAVEGAGNAGVARLWRRVNGHASPVRSFNAAVKPLPGFERAVAFTF